MAEQLRLDDAEILKLINNGELRRQFPFLSTYHAKLTHQSDTACCGKKKVNNTADYEAIRKSIGELPKEQKAKLKKALGGRQIVLSYSMRAGKRVLAKF